VIAGIPLPNFDSVGFEIFVSICSVDVSIVGCCVVMIVGFWGIDKNGNHFE